MGKKAKAAECCERFKKGKKPCDDCPKFAKLDKKARKKLLKRSSP